MNTESENANKDAQEPKVIKLASKKASPVEEMEVTQPETVVENNEEVTQLNPSEFGYRIKQKAPFEANIVMSAMQFLYRIVQEETTTSHELKPSFDETVNAVRESISPKGLQALQLANLLGGDHATNVNDGVAVHFSVLQKEVQGQQPMPNVGTPKKEG